MFDFISTALGMRCRTLNFGGGGGGSSGPTLQQKQLQTNQAITNANLNLEENAQRKAILNGMNGTRVFRGSALSRAMRGNTPGREATGAPSAAQVSASRAAIVPPASSLLDMRQSRASGATPAGGAGASATPSAGGAGRVAPVSAGTIGYGTP